MSTETALDRTGMHPGLGMVVLLGAMTAFGAVSIDMYLPAVPTIAALLGAELAAAERTVAVFFLGMGIGQLIYGPLADRIGRRPPLLAGVTLYVAASIACALANSVEILTVARFAQAIGACAGIVIARAVVRDRYDPNETARILSLLMLVMGLAPILAPLVGSLIMEVAGWRVIFWVLAVFGLATGLAIWLKLPESRSILTEETARGETALASYMIILGDRRLFGYLLTGSLNGACMFTYIVGSPGLLIGLYGMSPMMFGWVFGVNAIGLVAGTQLNRAMLTRWSSDQVLAVAGPMVLGCAVLLLISALTGWGGLFGILVPLFLILSTFGFTGSNTVAGALNRDPLRSGTVSAAFGGFSAGTGAVVSAIAGVLHDGTAKPMATVMTACAMGAVLSLFLLARPAKLLPDNG